MVSSAVRRSQGRPAEALTLIDGRSYSHPVNSFRGKILALLFGILVLSLCVKAPRPIIEESDEAFLRNQAQRIVASAGLVPGQYVGSWCNRTPFRMRVPGGNMGYTAFWVRDSVMMLGGDLISAEEVEDWIRLIAGTLVGPGDWPVRQGVVVPASAVPDHVNFDGRPTFYPGNYETGSEQGGYPWGKYPPLDDHFYFLSAVYHHWRMIGSARLFNSPVKTSFNELKLSDLCERVYRVAPVDPATGLVAAGDVETENAKDWGFCDGEFKSGRLLFPSILRFIAARQLAELFGATGRADKSEAYSQDAQQIQRSIPPTFFHPSQRPDEGWLDSATEVGRQPDVWGTAFAVWSGAVEGSTARRAGRALVRAFREKTAVKQGCVRQILTSDPTNNGFWQNSVCTQGEYQNGGYWGTPAGWYITAMAKVDRRAAADMAADYIRFLREHIRPDGITEAWEWLADNGQSANPLYVATVALPYCSLKEAGLLSRR